MAVTVVGTYIIQDIALHIHIQHHFPSDGRTPTYNTLNSSCPCHFTSISASIMSAINKDNFNENGGLSKDVATEMRPDFRTLKSIERHRREILLRVRLFS